MYRLNQEQRSLLQLHTPQLGSVALWRLKKRFTSYSRALQASPEALLQTGLTPKQVQSIQRAKLGRLLDRLITTVECLNIRIVLPEDSEFPWYYRQIEDRPAVLYVRGQLIDTLTLSMVGTRKTTAYGRAIAEEIAYTMARLGIGIVSGLAYGIDTIAHTAAVKAKGRTVGILGCGVDSIYPSVNQRLVEEMIQLGGGVVSEFPLFTPSYPSNFPIRNRLIAAYSPQVLIVEGDINGGAMLTMKAAIEYNREVWAVPGDITRAQASGPNSLLDQKGRPYLSINALVDAFHLELDRPLQAVELTDEEQQIVFGLSRNGTHLDDLAEALQLDISILSSKVVMLELKGVIRHEGAGVYRRII